MLKIILIYLLVLAYGNVVKVQDVREFNTKSVLNLVDTYQVDGKVTDYINNEKIVSILYQSLVIM